MFVLALRAHGVTCPRPIALFLFLLLAGIAFGQANITTATVDIGGLGAFSCYAPAQDPPTLNNGTTIAKGRINLSYDSIVHVLTLSVYNLTPEVSGEATPVIREIFLNLPQGGVIASAALMSQTATGPVQPNFTFAYDLVTSDNLGSLIGGCFGNFGIRLSDPGTIAGSIAANADVLPGPPGSMVTSPAVFTILIEPTANGAQTLRASSFANAISYPHTIGGKQAQATMIFEGAANLNVEGVVSNAPVGGPAGPAAGWVAGTVAPGSTVAVVAAGTPGLHTFLVVSTSPGPITIGGLTFPIGEINYILIDAVIPTSGWVAQPITIPTTVPEVTMVPVYGLVVNSDFNFRVVSLSEQFSLEVDF